MKMNILLEDLDLLDKKSTEGKNAMFYFFVENLDKEELPFIIEKIDQKIRRLKRSAEKEKLEKEKLNKSEEDKNE